MAETGEELVIGRILVALDTSVHSLAALEAAAELAARWGSELSVLFVEDINLIKLTELPFAQEVGLFSTARRPLGMATLERQFRAQASRMRRDIVRTAAQHKISWSFRVARGVIAAELLRAATEVDLVILGRAGHSPGGLRRLGSTARAILTEAPRLTLLLQQGVRLKWPIITIYDGSISAQKALATAAYLTSEQPDGLVVFTLAEDAETAHNLAQQADEWLERRDLTAHYRWLATTRITKLAQLIQLEQGGILILPGESPHLQIEQTLELLNEINCPVLLVRS